ncbi:hypothetical protein [Yersinia pestis]|uniref:hypothetical protein n=1 Tax=Yersinia pestis TaxID=632 RepID=UPI00187B4547|nr:hypothetical protein [Yersinia pestis]MBE7764621.1 hypothetical protein [Yersinia pestis]
MVQYRLKKSRLYMSQYPGNIKQQAHQAHQSPQAHQAHQVIAYGVTEFIKPINFRAHAFK